MAESRFGAAAKERAAAVKKVERAARPHPNARAARFKRRSGGTVGGLSKAVIEDLETALRTGLKLEPACDLAGLSYSTVKRWLREGRDERDAIAKAEREGLKPPPASIFHELHVRLRAATAEWERKHAAVIDKAGEKGDWRASLSMLERRRRKTWGSGVVPEKERPGAATAAVAVHVIAAPRESASVEEWTAEMARIQSGGPIIDIERVAGALPAPSDGGPAGGGGSDDDDL